ncbi:amino acid adenylation domain-containing protein [Actinopolyspora sp. H202]|uniref:amino acid adenylation domain-containing protein n=1 Tax=Actinopolyspora sp. H202 TaxID=1500456 RepID=UPI003EE530BE
MLETVQFNARRQDTLLGSCLPELLKQQAAVQPEAVAVADNSQHLSYRELTEASTRLAAHLNHLGVTTETRVGLYVEPSLELMTGAWGVLFAGGAYLPLSPEYPEDRLRYMIEDSGTKVIVTQGHLVERLVELAPQGTKIVTLDDAAECVSTPDQVPRSDNLAYVIYTSGSTGRPKGVMIEHRSLASQLRWMFSRGYLGKHTTVLQKTPMSFDAAQWEILAPACGGRVVMGAPGIYRDPELLNETIIEHEITTLQCVPTLLQALLETEEFRKCISLRWVFSGGEALSKQLARQLGDELPSVSLVNLYGPTECTINATAYSVDPATVDEGAGTVSIGTPVDNTQCFILDEEMAPVPIGETGELYIGGKQLARGYLHQPEMTEQRFVPSPFVPMERLYKTGDLAYWNSDGTIQFSGRVDNQVKLRGYRVELDEIALGIEEHTWVRRAAAICTEDPRTGFQDLVGCVQLNAKEAALMDQGNHGSHHQSKANKLQVKAQLSNPGLPEPNELVGLTTVDLLNEQPTTRQQREVFARKTYRFYEGGDVNAADIHELLRSRSVSDFSRNLEELTFAELGELLRWFGQFHSDERLLPKYAYASPGALYATRMYLEISGVAGLEPGVYYYHPAEHRLVRFGGATDSHEVRLKIHFLGKQQAVEPVYKNNIREVLEFETGHMVGVFEEVLPEYGLAIRPLEYREPGKEELGAAAEDHYLGTFEIRPNDGVAQPEATEIYVQAHPGRIADLPAGQYRYGSGELELISDELVLGKHVIAINQQVYARASFAITAVSRAGEKWLEYISLGSKLHHLQRNDLSLGFMSSGYSSKTGFPLPSAQRMDDILTSCDIAPGPSYFFLGGRVSQEQIRSEGMYEDMVHMRGPAEIIKDDLAHFLPDYMIPNRIVLLDEMPLTANGKVDCKTLAASDELKPAETPGGYVAPETSTERWLAAEWGKVLKYEDVSMADDFFVCRGNSLIAVTLVNKINREFGTRLPFQIVFEYPKLADLAARIDDDSPQESSRLVPLHHGGDANPVFCWPGLGGYPMNLRLLAREAGMAGPFYGMQAHGINAGEEPYHTIREMAAADVAEIRRARPEGPYTLWGYSFGARVAFEAAWQLESSGERVENLLLICPGNPKVREIDGERHGRTASYDNPAYVTILFSVFAGAISGFELDRCLEATHDEESFVTFVHKLYPALEKQLIRRITRIVGETYEFEYSFRELTERQLDAPVTLFKASGDDYSFIEGSSGYSAAPPTVVELESDHYGVLKERGVHELVSAIRFGLSTERS